MDSTRNEENEYSTIDYNSLAVDGKSTNSTSRSQLKSSEGNIYEMLKMSEPETLPLAKKEEGKKQNSQKSICSIKYGFLTSTLSLLFCLHCLETQDVRETAAAQTQEINYELIQLLNRRLKRLEMYTQKETILNEAIHKLKKKKSILMDTISSQKKAISEKEAAIASRDVDINRLKDKINELTLVQASVVLLGGCHSYYSDCFTITNTIYNSMEKSWKNCKLTLPSALGDHGAAIINNEIYIFGGYEDGTTQEPLKSLYKLGAENKWERMTDMNEKRSRISQSSIVFNSEIWVIGGWNGTNPLKSVEKYNPKTNNWTKMPELNESRTSAAATVVDGKIYVSGGIDVLEPKNSVEVYDPEKGKWEIFTPNMPYAVDSHILIRNNSHLITIGGDLSILEPTNSVWKIDVLDPKRDAQPKTRTI